MEININCDLGETSKFCSTENDPLLLKIVNSANIACGYHAGDKPTMEKTIKISKENKVSIGAHPSFNDPDNFGRKRLNLPSKEITKLIIDQINILSNIADNFEIKVTHVKPHGALYNMASINDDIAETIVLTIKQIDSNLKLYGPSKMKWKKISQKHKIEYVSEVFSDRNYNDNLTLVDRNLENSMITDIDNCINHLSRMIDRQIEYYLPT